jgi:hypothetical protein
MTSVSFIRKFGRVARISQGLLFFNDNNRMVTPLRLDQTQNDEIFTRHPFHLNPVSKQTPCRTVTQIFRKPLL